VIEYGEHITREYIRENPDKLFLFGDNLQKRGLGGQAKEMRREPNAIGIPTKKKPSMSDRSFFTDDEFLDNIHHIDVALLEIWSIKPDFNSNKDTVVIPKMGLGTGLAKLKEKAPLTYQYLLDRLNELGEDKNDRKN